jgi:hypothetical protein
MAAKKMVGMARFERATPASRTQCPTKLGHIPTSSRLLNDSGSIVHHFFCFKDLGGGIAKRFVKRE